MIKAILFDFDGVLTFEKYGSPTIVSYIAEIAELPLEKVQSCYQKYNEDLLLGKKTHKDIWDSFCSDLGSKLDYQVLLDSFSNVHLDEDMFMYIQTLKKKFLIGMVTDNKVDRIESILNKSEHIFDFDIVTISAQVKARKNSELIFKHVMQELGVNASECIFIDNTEKNLVVPSQMGMKTYLFDDEKRDLEAMKKFIEMNKLLGFDELPSEVMSQINQVVDIWKKHMGNKLVGIYLHGSITLHAFMPSSGDIDILIVVEDAINTQTRLAIAKELIEIDHNPCPLEMSAVRLCDVQPWKTPGNCVFHYSDFWTKRYLEKLANSNAECYVADHDFPDADVTSYIKLINQCGIVLYGKKIEEVFSDISDEDFWSAISAEVDDYDSLYKILTDSDIMQHYPYTFDEQRVRSWITRNIERYQIFGFGLWAVCLKETGEMIGDCGLSMQNIHGVIKPEIGYHIRHDQQRKGYAREAAIGVRDWTFHNTPFQMIFSYMKYTNTPSASTAVSWGCHQVDEYEDEVNTITKVFAISKKEWEKLV